MRFKAYSRELDHVIAALGFIRKGQSKLARKHLLAAAKSKKTGALLASLGQANQQALARATAHTKRRVQAEDDLGLDDLDLEMEEDLELDPEMDDMDMAGDDEGMEEEDVGEDEEMDLEEDSTALTASAKRRLSRAQANAKALHQKRRQQRQK